MCFEKEKEEELKRKKEEKEEEEEEKKASINETRSRPQRSPVQDSIELYIVYLKIVLYHVKS